MGAVVPIVNIPGIKPGELKLTDELLAAIYLGKISKWNDPKLVELNKGITLPTTAIAPVYRADGSGTTFVFTSYLSAVEPEWKDKVGASTSVKWLVGNGAKGNDGVAALVRQVKGGIGYVEFAYAAKNGLTTTQLRNHSGQFVLPTPETFAAAAAQADWTGAKNFAVSLIDLPGDKSWPILSTTFIELPKDPKDAGRSLAVLKFFDWAYKDGGKSALDLEYVPLPAAVQDTVRAAWKAEIKGPDGAPVFK
jgi:phosphate transport system substrate-binding protein